MKIQMEQTYHTPLLFFDSLSYTEGVKVLQQASNRTKPQYNYPDYLIQEALY